MQNTNIVIAKLIDAADALDSQGDIHNSIELTHVAQFLAESGDQIPQGQNSLKPPRQTDDRKAGVKQTP